MSELEKFKDMFEASRGSVAEAGLHIAQLGNSLDLDSLTEADWKILFSYYEERHEEFGVRTTDFANFRKIVEFQIPVANHFAESLKKSK